MLTIRNSHDRGVNQLDWLDSRHSFSFGGYYDPKHMGVSALRVINDDSIKPGTGFAMHSHQDMEIISYIKQGTIQHKDSMGNTIEVPAGEFQLMSAGSGIQHSEYNPSTSDTLELLQIWIEPNEYGITPSYQQKTMGSEEGLKLIVSPDPRDEVLKIHQDAYLYQLVLEPGQTLNYDIKAGRTIYIHMVSGKILVNGDEVNSGDGVTINRMETIQWTGVSQSEALVFDLP